ncbi:uncharacterized protein Tco025E_00050 [Trypanosoma conorhini]|uniref:Uncharacterized protein n=1 Tax=Trypanosoma conorhini TaxID=83891 RepID=A0A3R7SBI6_9TRYP|nr:uncharacterized protein Tco025E_00050 [Trypanosoma conorhini]RNF27666.1 hypothetical protein Tco025E_00050 [Trypanosoma conorhini]
MPGNKLYDTSTRAGAPNTSTRGSTPLVTERTFRVAEHRFVLWGTETTSSDPALKNVVTVSADSMYEPPKKRSPKTKMKDYTKAVARKKRKITDSSIQTPIAAEKKTSNTNAPGQIRA